MIDKPNLILVKIPQLRFRADRYLQPILNVIGIDP
jgi:hypothetical protein